MKKNIVHAQMAKLDTVKKILTDKSSLETCFQQIMKGEPLEMEVHYIYNLLNSLQIDLNGLQPKVQNILPFLLVHYIKIWPGWQKSTEYLQKEMTYDEWFQKFKDYLSFKLNFIINNSTEDIFEDVDQLSVDSPILLGIDNITQTDQLEKSLAPYSIEIWAPPRFLNTMVVRDGFNGDIILNEHNLKVVWPKKLSIRQLINWPNVEIEYKSKELHFKRSNLHDFQRFLGFGTYKEPCKEPSENCVLEMDIIDNSIPRKSYSLNVIKEYCLMYINLVKNNQKLLNLSNSSVNQIEIILEDLVLDLIDIDKNSIATNTNVLFNIGNCTYDRNRVANRSESSLRLTDLLTPNISLSFLSFTAFLETETDPFPLLIKTGKEGKKSLWADILPSISYRCTFCDKDFSDNEGIWSHLKKLHAMELPVMCYRCEKQFTILTLTQYRWRHECNSDNDLNTVSSTEGR